MFICYYRKRYFRKPIKSYRKPIKSGVLEGDMFKKTVKPSKLQRKIIIRVINLRVEMCK